jgi:transcriptional regulator with XRE-family HTH domain
MLREGRDARGISQRDLAARLGMTQRDVYNMESGAATKYAHRLFQIMAATGLTMTIELPEDRNDG